MMNIQAFSCWLLAVSNFASIKCVPRSLSLGEGWGEVQARHLIVAFIKAHASTADVSSATKMIMFFFIILYFYFFCWMITCVLPMPLSVTARKV